MTPALPLAQARALNRFTPTRAIIDVPNHD
jgi:hypothetical protein